MHPRSQDQAPIVIDRHARLAFLGCRLRAGCRRNLSDSKAGLVGFANQKATLRTPLAATIAVSVVRRASEVAQLEATDLTADIGPGMEHVKVARQENDQVGSGQLACLAASPSLGKTFPVRISDDWLWFQV